MTHPALLKLVCLLLISTLVTQHSFAQCPTVTPNIRSATNYSVANSAYIRPCSSNEGNLTGLTASNQAGTTTLTWHTATPATDANRLASVDNVGGGTRKLYAAFYNAAGNCYGPTKEITVYASICAADDDYSGTPVTVGTAKTLPTLYENDRYNGGSFTMPNANIGFVYEFWNKDYATINPDGTIEVSPTTPVGTHYFYYQILDQDPDGSGNINSSLGVVTIVIVPKTLPVDFGNIAASYSNNTLTVNWTTLNETNNDYFDVEISTNGKDFNKVGTVKSNATNSTTGNLNYTFSIAAGTSGLLSLSLLGFVCFIGFRKRVVKLLTVCFVALAFMGLYSCSKSDSALADYPGNIYIRIAQIDKDGKSSYSKVVKAVHE